jgi:hypothetical protein
MQDSNNENRPNCHIKPPINNCTHVCAACANRRPELPAPPAEEKEDPGMVNITASELILRSGMNAEDLGGRAVCEMVALIANDICDEARMLQRSRDVEAELIQLRNEEKMLRTKEAVTMAKLRNEEKMLRTNEATAVAEKTKAKNYERSQKQLSLMKIIGLAEFLFATNFTKECQKKCGNEINAGRFWVLKEEDEINLICEQCFHLAPENGIKMPQVANPLKLSVWLRSNGPSISGSCHICTNRGVKGHSLHFLTDWNLGNDVSKRFGGSKSLENLRPLHATCNRAQGTRTYAQYFQDIGQSYEPVYAMTIEEAEKATKHFNRSYKNGGCQMKKGSD